MPESASRGMSAPGGVCLMGDCSRGVSAPGVSALGVSALGVSAPGGCLLQGGVCSGGLSAPGGVCSGRGVCGGVCSQGGVASKHALRQTPPCEQNDKQVQKYYLGHNFVAAGKNAIFCSGCQSVHGKLSRTGTSSQRNG